MASVAKRRWNKPDGTVGEAWTVRYLDQGGRHRQKTFVRKKEADAFGHKVETDRARGMLAPQADKMTIGIMLDHFERHMAERQKDGRIGETHRYRVSQFVRVHIRPFLANVKLADASLSKLTEWHREMQRARKISPATARQGAQVLKMAFDFAMRREWIHRNPVLQLLAELRGISVARVRTFSVEELRLVLKTAGAKSYQGRIPESHLRVQCAVHLAAFCGLRVGEILGLHVANVDFERGVIRVAESHSRRDGIKGPKSVAGRRDIAMPAHIVVLLQAWVDRYMRPNANGRMFATSEGRPHSADAMRAAWGRLLHRAGLSPDPRKPAFHFHALRHFAASWMIDAGWSLPEVAKSLGHAKVDMTLSVYAHALEHRSADATQMQALSDRLMALPQPEVAHTLRMAL